MTAKSHQRGWPIVHIDGHWVYKDTGESIEMERPCCRCHQMPTAEGHDACLGKIPGVISACCGHGVEPPFTEPQLKCWHCNNAVHLLPGGWLCTNCGQHGSSFDQPATTVDEGCLQNSPYMEPSCPV